MILSPEQARALAAEIEQLLEGSGYVLLVNSGNATGGVENEMISNLPAQDQKDFLKEWITVLEKQ